MNNDPDLLDLLDVNRTRLPRNSLGFVTYCQRAWVVSGKPAEVGKLQGILEKAITFAPTVGLIYPKVFLKRLKQLQRGEWGPQLTAIAQGEPRE